MEATPEAPTPPSTSPRWLVRFAIATWIATVLLIALYALFWRIAYFPPHALWAIATTGAVVLAGSLTIILGIWRILRGPHRTIAAATVLLGTTPIVWFAMFMLTLFLKGKYREPVPMNIPTCIAGVWATSIADVEARWRYPRWTYGTHAILLDDGQIPEPEKLVAQMDEHFEQMAATLHTSVPPVKARWVRGSVIWQHGNALPAWAICDADQNSPDLTPLDRHEMAHVLIMSLGSVDQDPPALLNEGWAETQSKERDELILTLADSRERGTTYPLQELVGPGWYERSYGPVYDHGGPLVVYLMEHYGAEKFLRLFHSVGPDTIAADCERILGDSWQVVEERFWKWLADEANKLKAERGKKPPPPGKTDKDVQLANSVNSSDWQAIVDGYRAAWSKRPPMPKTCAFAVENNWTAPPNNSDKHPPKTNALTECVVDGESIWQVQTYQPNGKVYCTVFTPRLAASVQLSADGRAVQADALKKSDATSALDYGNAIASSGDLGHFLPINARRHYEQTTRIDAIRPPSAPDQSIWQIDYAYRNPDDKAETKQHLDVDAGADWLIVNGYDTTDRSLSETQYKLATILGRHSTAEQKSRHTDKEGEWTLHNRIRELTSAEAQQVREKAEKIAHLQPELNWLALLIRPLTVAIAWPATGVLALGVGIFVRHRENRG